MIEKKRMTDVDIVKSIGIILMVMGHIEFGTVLDFYIHSFHMPLFFLMSGYLYRDKKIRFTEFTLQKIRTLLVPYICVGLVHYIIKIPYIIYTKDNLLSPILNLLFDNSDGLPIAGALWFLTAIFFSYELMYVVRMISSLIAQVIIVVLIVVSGYFLSGIVTLPWSLTQSFVCFGFMYLGWLVREKGQNIFKTIIIPIIALIGGFIIATFNSPINVRTSHYGNLFLFYCAAFFIVIGLMGCVRCIVGNRDNKCIGSMQHIGINSLIYMCFNQLIVWLPNKVLSRYSGPTLYLLKAFELLLALLVLGILAKLLNKSTVWGLITGRKTHRQ